MYWGYLALGLLLLVVSGMVVSLAVYEGGVTLWLLGILAFSLGALSTVAAMARSGRLVAKPGAAAERNASGAPLLGEMLVNYGLIAQSDLDKALARQRKSEEHLGRVLVKMGLVTHAQVAGVLEEQLSRREEIATESQSEAGTPAGL